MDSLFLVYNHVMSTISERAPPEVLHMYMYMYILYAYTCVRTCTCTFFLIVMEFVKDEGFEHEEKIK